MKNKLLFSRRIPFRVCLSRKTSNHWEKNSKISSASSRMKIDNQWRWQWSHIATIDEFITSLFHTNKGFQNFQYFVRMTSRDCSCESLNAKRRYSNNNLLRLVENIRKLTNRSHIFVSSLGIVGGIVVIRRQNHLVRYSRSLKKYWYCHEE